MARNHIIEYEIKLNDYKKYYICRLIAGAILSTLNSDRRHPQGCLR